MKKLIIVWAAMICAVIAPAAIAGSDPVYTAWHNNNAVGGYDVTTFYTGVPQAGKAEYSFEHDGARWMFTTQTNRDKFAAAPDDFAPAYGGYCAWAMANHKLAKGNPKHWNVEDGRLYLNFNGRIKTRWEKDKPGFIAAANENWPAILGD